MLLFIVVQIHIQIIANTVIKYLKFKIEKLIILNFLSLGLVKL